MTPSQRLREINQGFLEWKVLSSNITSLSPITQLLKKLIQKKLIDTKFPHLESEILSGNLSFKTKEQLFKMQENWRKQPYKMQRCKHCERDIPGGQDVFMFHLNIHFKKYTEHRNRIEQIESHPYKSF